MRKMNVIQKYLMSKGIEPKKEWVDLIEKLRRLPPGVVIEDGGFQLWKKGKLNWLRNQAYSIRMELASLLWNSA